MSRSEAGPDWRNSPGGETIRAETNAALTRLDP